MSRIILASTSPRRKELLHLAGFNFEVYNTNADESYPEELSINEIAEFIAVKKAEVAHAHFSQNETIIAADTLVVLEERIIGKPENREHALEILTALSGKTHRVITGVCIIKNNVVHRFSETTYVDFKTLTTDQIIHYVDTFQPFDKAGAYAIQEWIGAVGISGIRGDYYNVVGFPLNRIFDILNNS